MMKKLFPEQMVDTIFDIDYEKLYAEGKRGLMYDLDNTLAPCKVLEADDKVVELFEKLKNMGFNICLVSNNNKKRVIRYNEKLKLVAIPKAKKPLTRNLKKGMEMIHSTKETTVMIGDQIFTDVLAGNRLGISTILVNPIHQAEHLRTKIKRSTENKILNKYKKRVEKNDK